MIYATPAALANFVAPWAHFYSDSRTAETIVVFLHIAPLVVGGGVAIALDRASLRLRIDEAGSRERHLAELRSVHPLVLCALAISLVSGLALLAADLDTFLPSWVFWLKMVLVLALLANGAFMTRLERVLGTPGGASTDHWRRLRGISITSVVLWLAITLAGVALVNV